ncbi:acyltransferase [Thalassolituus marinus]|uniref:Acyltransferase n=1 Tax=Thalassolituus marinus TaxID=671053 RepID=A0ABS7ZV64_9GAMM|nr:acyltransferase [Thalassolituus marinus]MCA6065042.1 acyltransferase [Thalassolituus marinus]
MFRKILRPFLRFLLSCFFEEKYLRGRYFTENYIGYGWALKSIWLRNVLRIYRPVGIPISSSCIVSNHKNMIFHPDDLHIFQVPGVYYQNFDAKIVIGKGSYIAPNVGIITANHNLVDLDLHSPGKDVVLGENCWVGMNSMILPGVVLGPRTVVAAGAVVTKSFIEGDVVLAGVPAVVVSEN